MKIKLFDILLSIIEIKFYKHKYLKSNNILLKSRYGKKTQIILFKKINCTIVYLQNI